MNLWKRLNISNDDFVRTTEPRHTRVVQKALQQLYDKGEIYQRAYTGWYCTFDERFWTEKDVIGGLCPECKRPVEQLSETNYFFRMSKYQEWLIAYIKQHPDFLEPRSRHNEVLGFLQKPLEDLSISRPKSRLAWGIELPFDPNYVTYVWFDALVNYISVPGYLVDDAHHPFRILVDHAQGIGIGTADHDFRARLVDGEWREDVEEPRKRDRPECDRGRIRRGPVPLLSPA